MAMSMGGLYLARAWGALLSLPSEAKLLSSELCSVALPFPEYGHIDELDRCSERNDVVLRARLYQFFDI